jgi:hypothetical protein
VGRGTDVGATILREPSNNEMQRTRPGFAWCLAADLECYPDYRPCNGCAQANDGFVMAVVLRMIGVVEVLSGAAAMLLLAHLFAAGGTRGDIFVVLLAATLLVLSPLFVLAGIELLRLRDRGRRLSLSLMVVAGVFTICLAVAQGRVQPHQIVRLTLEVATALLLASASARRATHASMRA